MNFYLVMKSVKNGFHVIKSTHSDKDISKHSKKNVDRQVVCVF